MAVVNLGILGVGNWSKKLASTIQNIDNINLLTCFSRTSRTREEFAQNFGCEPSISFDKFINDKRIDGIIIATPHTTHVDLICSIAKCKKHIMVEKPLALSSIDAKRCVDVTKENNVLLQVAHYRRLLPATRLLHDKITKNKLGKIHLIESNFSRPFGPDPSRPWRDSEIEAPAGAFTALGVHMIDNMIYLGGDVQSVNALSSVLDEDKPLDDITSVLIKFKSGAHGVINTSLRLPFIANICAQGNLASAWSEDDGNKFFIQKINEEKRTEIILDKIDGVEQNLRNFCSSIVNRIEPETNGEESSKVVRVLEAIVDSSAKEGLNIQI